MKGTVIVYFTFTRLTEFKASFDSLRKNKNFDSFPIFIYNDGPRNETDLSNVNEVRDFIMLLASEFPTQISYCFHDKNQGLSNSIINGVTEAFTKYEKAIIIEDDIILSKYFLSYMNSNLNVYHSSEQIFTISAYSFILNKVPKSYPYSNYLSLRPFPWGWGTWKNRWEKIIWDKSKLLTIWEDTLDNKSQFNQGGSDLSPMLINEFNGKINSWDVLMMYNQHILKMYSVFPLKSYTINVGWGASSTHNKGFNHYQTALISREEHLKFNFCSEADLDSEIIESFRYNFSNEYKIITRLKSINSLSSLIVIIKDFITVIKRKIL